MTRTIDLNIFYREDYSEEAGTTWADTLTIDPYIYVDDDLGTRKYEVDLLIECTHEETAQIAKHYPLEEYGSDWWDFIDNFMEFAPVRVASLLKTIDADQVRQEPSWWVSIAEEILI